MFLSTGCSQLMHISVAQTLNCVLSFTGYVEIQTEMAGVGKMFLQFGLRPDGKSSVGRPKCRWKVVLNAQSV